MNYRHIYHAGNLCEVVKHAALVWLAQHYREKDTAFCVVDTHAGAGLYDLNDPRAQKTGEYHQGIECLLQAPACPELADYLGIVRTLNAQNSTLFYPGSPYLLRHLLRAQDCLIGCELHPDDVAALKRLFHNDKRVHIHHRDGYEALKALLPPKEKRGIVYIDPPFENPDEFSTLVRAVLTVSKQWPASCVMIWYPIKERPGIWHFHETLTATGLNKLLCAEYMFNDETRADRLNGSGFIFWNPPWQFDRQLENLFFALRSALKTNGKKPSISWLAHEKGSAKFTVHEKGKNIP